MTSDTDSDTELKLVNRYLSAGKFSRARSVLEKILSQSPSQPRALCMMARVRAELNEITFDEALTTIKYLVISNPENERIPASLVSILYKIGRRDESAVERKIFLERFPDSSVALQYWANGLQADPKTKSSPETQIAAWGFYQKALASGPLLTPCFKSAAYYAGKRADPSKASDAFKGSGFVERMALRTRGVGPQNLVLVFFLGVVASVAVFHSGFALSIVLQALTLSWGVWCIYSNNLMCCKKCRNFWIFLVGYATMFAAILDHPRTWYVVAVAAAGIFAWAARTNNLEMIWPRTNERQKEDALP
jgi:tetratricopeptide (TPR) repeat protein